MQRKLIKTLFFVSTLALVCQGCSTTQVRVRKRERIEVCVPDPRSDALQCVDEKGDPLTRPFQGIGDGKFVCFPVDPITKILEDQ